MKKYGSIDEIAKEYALTNEQLRNYLLLNDIDSLSDLDEIDLSDKDIKDAVISNGSIYFIKNDTVYKKNRYGIKEVIKNNEFIYNFKNIVNAYYKEEM